jgi:hypothetical protein
MFDTNDFEAGCPATTSNSGFAAEYPFDDAQFDDAQFDDAQFAEVEADDPWFADVDSALDRGADVDPGVLERLVGLCPDASVVARLAGIDRRSLSPEDAVAFSVVAERVIAWLSSLQDDAILAAGSGHTQMAEFLAHDPRPDRCPERTIRIADVIREELATAHHWTLNHAHDRLVRARLLAAGLPRTRRAHREGRISSAHVQALVQQATRLPGALAVLAGDATPDERLQFTKAADQFEARALPTAERDTAARAKAAARRAVIVIDAAGEARRRAQAKAIRDAFVVVEDDGLALFAVRMATEQAYACLAAVDALAHDDRFPSPCHATIGERRAEAAAALILGSPGEGLPEARLRAHLDITIDLDTLLGLRRDADGIAEVAGAGPVSADVVRALLADPDVAVTMRRLITDPETSHLLDCGRRTYEVPDRLREFLTARDRNCRFPGCARKASACQLDHALAWADGGETSPANLGALCVRHHQLKTHAGWSIANSHTDGSCTWTSPHGREHQRESRPIGARDPAGASDPDYPPF